MDDRYLEYDSLATDDDGSCVTLAAYGCTDPLAFNYNPLADRMLLTSPCTYNLTLYDDGGDSWGDCWLGVKRRTICTSIHNPNTTTIICIC